MIPNVIDQVRKRIEEPVSPVSSPADEVPVRNNTATSRARRNFFRTVPTSSQAMAVGASPVSDSQYSASITKPEPLVNPVTPKIDPSVPSSGLDYINSFYTSPEEELRMRKSSVQRQRILAVADALRHVGNIYNTTRYAPVQRFSNPVEEERQRYLGEKQLRDADNWKVMSYQQAKDRQEMLARQAQQEYDLKAAELLMKRGYNEAQIQAMMDRVSNQAAYNEALLEIRRNEAEERRRLNDERLRQGDERIAISRNRAAGGGRRSGGGRTGTISEYDIEEEKIKKTNPDGTTSWTTKRTRRKANGGATTTSRTRTTQPRNGNNGKKKNRLGL